MYLMKAILILALFAISSCDYSPYRNCDPKWGLDKLWVDYVDSSKSYTFCYDENGRNPTFFNGKLITLTAEGLANFVINCDNAVCTPGIVNQMIIKYGKDDFISKVGIVDADGTPKDIKVSDYLDCYILLNSYIDPNFNIPIFFIVTGSTYAADKQIILGNNHLGLPVQVSEDQIQNYMGWKKQVCPPKDTLN